MVQNLFRVLIYFAISLLSLLGVCIFFNCSLHPYHYHKPLHGLRPAKPICEIFYSCSFLLLGRLVTDHASALKVFGLSTNECKHPYHFHKPLHGLRLAKPVENIFFLLKGSLFIWSAGHRPCLGSQGFWVEYQRMQRHSRFVGWVPTSVKRVNFI